MPKLCGLDRIVIFKFIDSNPEKFDPELLFSHVLNTIEIRILHDHSHKDILIYDLAGAKMAHLMKMTLTVLKRIEAIIEVSKC